MSDPTSAASVEEARTSIGVIGGGQLAWMLARAAEGLGISVHVQAPDGSDPAVHAAASFVQAPVDDVEATRELARRCGAITFENEWLPLDALRPLSREGIRFLPSLEALRPLISKRQQRELLERLHLPGPRWCPLSDTLAPLPEPESDDLDGDGEGAGGTDDNGRSPWSDVHPKPEPPQEWEGVPRLPEGWSFPVMAKSSTGGYDGKGTRPILDPEALADLVQEVDPTLWILEEFVSFDHELAMVACRDQSGRIACFPLVQTHQHQQICNWVLYPAPVDHAVRAFARNLAASLLTSLDYVGVMGIEFFHGPAGLLVNELAPRTHNSGHLTIEAMTCSQFEQQARIVAGRPMAPIEPRVAGALMVNLLGFEWAQSSYQEPRQRLADLPGAQLHWYGKTQAAPGRKLGHLSLTLKTQQPDGRFEEAQRRLQEIRAIWPLPS